MNNNKYATKNDDNNNDTSNISKNDDNNNSSENAVLAKRLEEHVMQVNSLQIGLFQASQT